MERATKIRIGVSLVEAAIGIGIFYAAYNPSGSSAADAVDFGNVRYKTIEEKTASGEVVSEVYCSVPQKNGVITHFRINPDGKTGIPLEAVAATMKSKALEAMNVKNEAAAAQYDATLDVEKKNINRLEKLADDARNAWGWSNSSSSTVVMPAYEPTAKKASAPKTLYDLEKELDSELKKEEPTSPPVEIPPRPLAPAESLELPAPAEKLVPIVGWRNQ